MRAAPLDELLPAVAAIVADVRARGDEAAPAWDERVDGERPASLRVPAEPIATRASTGRRSTRSGAWPRRSRPLTPGNGRRTPGSSRCRGSWSSGASGRSTRSGSASRAVAPPLVSPLVMTAVPDPEACAADVLAQAEHGPDGEAVLVTTSHRLADEVAARVDGRARVEVVGSLADAIARANGYAPERLELLVDEPAALAEQVASAGSVFLGTTAVLGDSAAGVSHVPPAGGRARGLGLEAFLKPIRFVRATAEGLAAVRATVEALAELEGPSLHAGALAVRT